MLDCIKVCITNVDTLYFAGMKLPEFFTTFTQTCTSLSGYASQMKQRGTYLLGYFFVVVSILLLVGSTIFASRVVPQVVVDSQKTASEFIENYPQDLTFTWDGATLQSTHTNFPIFFPSMFQDSTKYGFPSRLAFVTNSELRESVENSSSYLFIITPTKLQIQETAESWSEFSLTSILTDTPYTLTKDSAKNWTEAAVTFLQSNQGKSIVLVSAILALFQLIVTIIGLLWKSFLIYLFSTVLGAKRPYAQSLKLTILLLVPAIAIQVIGDLIYPEVTFDFVNLTFWLLFIFLVWRGPLQKVYLPEKTTQK